MCLLLVVTLFSAMLIFIVSIAGISESAQTKSVASGIGLCSPYLVRGGIGSTIAAINTLIYWFIRVRLSDLVGSVDNPSFFPESSGIHRVLACG
jgi:hypothetical protein